jgi:hypothetical protein
MENAELRIEKGDRSSQFSSDSIEDAIQYLDDYLTLLSDRSQAREVRDRLAALV